MKFYRRKQIARASQKTALLLAVLIIITGSLICLSYNNIMTSLTKQQLTAISDTAINRLDSLFYTNENILLNSRNRILSQAESAGTPEQILLYLNENCSLKASAWYCSNGTLFTTDPSISYSQLCSSLSKTTPHSGEHSMFTAPFINDNNKVYADHVITIDHDSYIGYRICLDTIYSTAQLNTSTSEEIKSFLVYKTGKHLKTKTLSVDFDNCDSILLHAFIPVKYSNTDYVGINSRLSNSNWYLISAIPKTNLLKNIIITDMFLAVLVVVALIVIVFVIENKIAQIKKAKYDSLTGAYTLDAFTKKIQKMHRSSIYDYCICQMDIHNFKMINEREGTQYGDILLQKIIQLLKKELPVKSAVCRIHSDIFCFCFPFHSKKQTQYLLEDITEHIADIHSSNISIYYGLYICCANDTDMKATIGYANIALKYIKGSPLSYFAFFEDYMLDDMAKEANIEADMYTALDEKQFKVYLQPKCSMEKGNVIGAEALVRWEHPQKGRICPDVFIPLFEKNGFISKLDEYMWNETAQILADWIKKGYPIIPISVNISRAQKLGYPLCRKFQMIIEKYQIPAQYLQLEFTESAFGDDTEELYKTMQDLHEMGFTILMDDFGSGYSSLNMLKQCSADIIKIDKEFLKNITAEDKSDNGTILLQNIIQLLQKLKLGVVVEGVETEKHVNLLLECGCDTAQGYFYSPPLTVSEFNQFAFSATSPHRVA